MVLVQTTLEGARVELDQIITNIDQLKAAAIDMERIMFRSLVLLRRLTGGDDLARGIMMFQRAVVQARQLHLALTQLQAAYLAGGPVAWTLALLGLAVTAMSYVDFVETARRTR